MVGTPINGRTRPAFAVVNGGAHDLGPSSAPPSNAGSDYGIIEFTREDVVGLLVDIFFLQQLNILAGKSTQKAYTRNYKFA